ncbi:Murein peptide amidase A [Arenibacter antarcticus]|uniref:M14 metallopeptidase family protein n=1 Tax=Arenibacter antarcticus TaxID=2040469 RepID=A0ABW5VIJ6_9FLAO|nr:M14 metallopeptidase family protein [Arenibacter sp. H213]MCM4166270.1 peptidase M14 [Arenibacter sp. H213]
MKHNYYLIIIALFAVFSVFGQHVDITDKLFSTYEKYQEHSLTERRIKHGDLQPLISKIGEDPRFQVNKVGESIEGRSLSLISVGTGNIDVFLWSQMHGDEPTATQAIFDILNFLSSENLKQEKEKILKSLKLHFLPMLNPDGAQVYTRRNALGIDINRDALMLQSPEGKTLKRVRDSLNAKFGFNLHDQSTYYNAERTNKPATVSYLAPAYNYEKDINEVRANAMKVIVFMNNIIQNYAPGQVGRYNDDFEPRAFGDNIQKWGTSAILIESGGYKDDVEKQYIRKLNYVSILSAIYTIANGNYKDISIADYEKIPENDRKLFDLKLKGVTYDLLGKKYKLDVGIHRFEVDDPSHNNFYYSSKISDQGDLSTFYGYEVLDAQEHTIKPGKIYPNIFKNLGDLSKLKVIDLLKLGYTYIRVDNIPKDKRFGELPINIIGPNYKVPKFNLQVGNNPTFLLERNGKNEYAVINGFLIDLKTGDGKFKNAMIFK